MVLFLQETNFMEDFMDFTIMHNHFRFLMNNKWAGRQNHGDCLEYFYKEKRAMDWICIYIPVNYPHLLTCIP